MKPQELAEALARQTGIARQDGKHCVKCRQSFRWNPGPDPQKQGDIYSQAGLTEATKISGLCEFCFDRQFGGQLSPKLNWATRTGAFKSAAPMTAMTHAAILRTVMPEGVTVVAVSETLIRITGRGKVIEVHGTVPR